MTRETNPVPDEGTYDHNQNEIAWHWQRDAEKHRQLWLDCWTVLAKACHDLGACVPHMEDDIARIKAEEDHAEVRRQMTLLEMRSKR